MKVKRKVGRQETKLEGKDKESCIEAVRAYKTSDPTSEQMYIC